MPRSLHRLSSLEVSRKRKPGLFADGGNLYLSVSNVHSKSWIFRYSRNGATKDMGLGSLNAVSLARARERAGRHREQLANGIDPLGASKAARQQEATTAAKAMTFREAAETYMRAQAAGWRNLKHRAQWHSTLETYVYPVFGDVSVADVDVGLVMKVVEPIWTTKTETASRVRGRIELVLDWATALELRSGDNPARWRGHLKNLLPARKKVRRVIHHPALPYDKMAAFTHDLRAQ
ncbi:MAG: Arm DNA-binding domain-containing protein, partial [Alphaproteobacteria bacterium]|nr:Arm DNA-binding domain-containing protein [Alphaproteobacteria bacterium]